MQPGRMLPMLFGAVLLTAGCGGSSSTNPSSKTTSAPPTTLLVQPSQIPAGFTVSTAPSTFQSLDATGLQRTFGNAGATAAKAMRDYASATYDGPSGSQLVLESFVFTTPANAQAVWSGFAGQSGGTKTLATPSGAPGVQRGLYETSFSSGAGLGTTYLFREGNVLSQVELDGKPNQFSVSQLITLAKEQDAHIRSALK